MAYELFTGKPPFYDAEEPLAILLRHISEALPPASEVADVDPEISAWIERLTSKDPKDRPQSATVAWEEFEEILIGKLGPRWRREAQAARSRGSAADGPEAQGGAESDEWNTRDARCPVRRRLPRPRAGAADRGDRLRGDRPGHRRPLPASEDRGAGVRDVPPAADRPAGGGRVGAGAGAAEPEPRRSARWSRSADREPQPEPAGAADAAADADAGPDARARQPARRRSARRCRPGAASSRFPAPATCRFRLGSSCSRSAGALALLAGLLIPVLAEWPDRWNVFAVLSPFEAVGVALGTWVVAQALTARRASPRRSPPGRWSGSVG